MTVLGGSLMSEVQLYEPAENIPKWVKLHIVSLSDKQYMRTPLVCELVNSHGDIVWHEQVLSCDSVSQPNNTLHTSRGAIELHKSCHCMTLLTTKETYCSPIMQWKHHNDLLTSLSRTWPLLIKSRILTSLSSTTWRYTFLSHTVFYISLAV